MSNEVAGVVEEKVTQAEQMRVLIAGLAAEQAMEVTYDYANQNQKHLDVILRDVLERRLLPLLLAGQAMRNATRGLQRVNAWAAWDAALEAAAQGESGERKKGKSQ